MGYDDSEFAEAEESRRFLIHQKGPSWKKNSGSLLGFCVAEMWIIECTVVDLLELVLDLLKWYNVRLNYYDVTLENE